MANRTVYGRIDTLDRGAFDVNTPYDQYDEVTYGGASYIAMLACTGIPPSHRRFWRPATDFETAGQVTAAASDIDALQIAVREKTKYGPLSGLVVAAQSTPDMTVQVSGGVIYLADGNRYEIEAFADLEIEEADAALDRIDIVYVDTDGEIAYESGTPAAEPEAPDTPAGAYLLAEIEVAAEAESIVTLDITDKRTLLVP